MIALVGLEKYKIKKFDNMDLEAIVECSGVQEIIICFIYS